MEIKINEERLRFETPIGTEFAFIDYRWYKENIVLMHTFVPEAGQGKGIAAALAKFALEYVREKNIKAKVYCPFILKYLEKHPEHDSIITK